MDHAEQAALDKKAQQLLEEKEAEARLRTYKGPMAGVIALALCAWTAFQLVNWYVDNRYCGRCGAETHPAEDERAILEAACQAPTGGNQQPYTIIVARSQELKDALAISCESVKKHTDICYSGEGVDEFYGGYRAYKNAEK